MKQTINFKVYVGDDEDKRLAFCESIRIMIRERINVNLSRVIRTSKLNGNQKWFTVSENQNVENLIGHIAGYISFETNCSDMNPYMGDSFIPSTYEVVFLQSKKEGNKTIFISKTLNEDNEVIQEEIDEEQLRMNLDGELLPFTNHSGVDLSVLQIYPEVNPKNYSDNCFIYACIQSCVFIDLEIETLQMEIKTKKSPNNKINDIAKRFRCNFVVKRIDKEIDVMRVNINTQRNKKCRSFKRCVELILYKDHYMIDLKLPVTTYYLKHKEMLKQKFPSMDQQKMQLIR
ncbi:hypothetical protein TRFO_29449 [Tritrichomonas foetus]|uniref:Uncharacterized protein n=1 Tax=Tritrichomonas foetus TaxID=1144522 RepID=A0A1J4JXR1_9EUKA|nr:hypothetical protein TRFO_29449 [Tritrichomonas foetus]|eukprot:OHT03248.1 hypothetical protein TRFO_29449 [Tritrichomonas foetus]